MRALIMVCSIATVLAAAPEARAQALADPLPLVATRWSPERWIPREPLQRWAEVLEPVVSRQLIPFYSAAGASVSSVRRRWERLRPEPPFAPEARWAWQDSTFHIARLATPVRLRTPTGTVNALHHAFGASGDDPKQVVWLRDSPEIAYWDDWTPISGGGLWAFCIGDTTPDLNGDGTDDFGIVASGYVHGSDVGVWLSGPDGYVRSEMEIANPCLRPDGRLDSEAFWKGGGASIVQYAALGTSLREVLQVHYSTVDDSLDARGQPLVAVREVRGDRVTVRHVLLSDIPSSAKWWEEDWESEMVEEQRKLAAGSIRYACKNAYRYSYVAARTFAPRLPGEAARDACRLAAVLGL